VAWGFWYPKADFGKDYIDLSIDWDRPGSNGIGSTPFIEIFHDDNFWGEILPDGLVAGPIAWIGPDAASKGRWLRSGALPCLRPVDRLEAETRDPGDIARQVPPPRPFSELLSQTLGSDAQSAADSPLAEVGPNDGLAGLLDKCKQGFVRRNARNDDRVCVSPESRDRVRVENARAASLVDPNPTAPAGTCISGYVWREAFDGDTVCVTPDVRERVREENRLSESRNQ
jgi:hypothetical protein